MIKDQRFQFGCISQTNRKLSFLTFTSSFSPNNSLALNVNFFQSFVIATLTSSPPKKEKLPQSVIMESPRIPSKHTQRFPINIKHPHTKRLLLKSSKLRPFSSMSQQTQLPCPKTIARHYYPAVQYSIASQITTTAHPTRIISHFQPCQHLHTYDNYIFDLDGVVFKHYKCYPWALGTLAELQNTYQKNVIVCTNNSSKSRKYFHDLFLEQSGGLLDLPLRNIFTAASTAAQYVKKRYTIPDLDENDTQIGVLFVGESGFVEECTLNDIAVFPLVQYGPALSELSDSQLRAFIQKNNIKAILHGTKYRYPEGFNTLAQHIYNESDLDYIFTNEGVSEFDIEPKPGNTPIYLGKPNPVVFDAILSRMAEHGAPQLDSTRTIMIGDTPGTDMAFAINNKIDSCLVFAPHSYEIRNMERFLRSYPFVLHHAEKNTTYHFHETKSQTTPFYASPLTPDIIDRTTCQSLVGIKPTYIAQNITDLLPPKLTKD